MSVPNTSSPLLSSPLANISTPSSLLWLPTPFSPSHSFPLSWPTITLPFPLLPLLLPLLLTYLILHHLTTRPRSPISRLPGPFFAHNGPYFVLRLLARSLSRDITSLHRQYGPGSAVVIAPNIVSVSDPEDVRRVYGSHQFRKDGRLGQARFGGVSNVFAELDPAAHTKLLRLTSPSFRPSALSLTQPSLHRVLRSFCARIERDTLERGSADVWKLYRLLSFDMLGGACFGQELGCVEKGGHAVVDDLDAFMVETAMRAVMPSWFCWLLERLPIPKLRFILKADQRLADYGLAALQAHRKIYPSLSPGDETGDMLGPLRLSLDPDTGAPMSDAAIAGNLATYILAGADTTPAALSFLTWELARRPEVYDRLRQELERKARETGMVEGDEWEFDKLRECEYLEAVVREGLRRYPPTVMPMTRVVPEGGMRLSRGAYVAAAAAASSAASSAAAGSSVSTTQPPAEGEEIVLEPGTYVCAPAWTLHFDPLTFPNPEQFDPERWLRAKEGTRERDRMDEAWIPFGVGVRRCQGRLLAEMELYLTIATVVSRYELKLHPTTTEESMREVEMVTLGPKARRCEIVFVPRPMEVLL